MKVFKIGDKGRAICDSCKELRTTTYELKDVPLSDKSDIVKDVLVGVCDTCKSICALPQQSLPLVQATIGRTRDSVEVRLTQAADDVFNLVCSLLNTDKDFRPKIVRYYTHHMLRDVGNLVSANNAMNILRKSNSELMRGRKIRRMSVKGVELHAEVNEFKNAFHLRENTEWINTIAIKVKDDLIDKKEPKVMQDLRNIVAACR